MQNSKKRSKEHGVSRSFTALGNRTKDSNSFPEFQAQGNKQESLRAKLVLKSMSELL